MLTLGGDTDASARFRGGVTAVARAVVLCTMGPTGQSRVIGYVIITLAVRWTLLWNGLTSCVGQRLRLLELCFIGDGPGDRLVLYQAEVVLLGRPAGVACSWTRGGLGSGRRTAILDDEVGAEFVTTHVVHWRQIVLNTSLSCCSTSFTRHVLMHDVGEVDPLVTVPIAVLR